MQRGLWDPGPMIFLYIVHNSGYVVSSLHTLNFVSSVPNCVQIYHHVKVHHATHCNKKDTLLQKKGCIFKGHIVAIFNLPHVPDRVKAEWLLWKASCLSGLIAASAPWFYSTSVPAPQNSTGMAHIHSLAGNVTYIAFLLWKWGEMNLGLYLDDAIRNHILYHLLL